MKARSAGSNVTGLWPMYVVVHSRSSLLLTSCICVQLPGLIDGSALRKHISVQSGRSCDVLVLVTSNRSFCDEDVKLLVPLIGYRDSLIPCPFHQAPMLEDANPREMLQVLHLKNVAYRHSHDWLAQVIVADNKVRAYQWV